MLLGQLTGIDNNDDDVWYLLFSQYHIRTP